MRIDPKTVGEKQVGPITRSEKRIAPSTDGENSPDPNSGGEKHVDPNAGGEKCPDPSDLGQFHDDPSEFAPQMRPATRIGGDFATLIRIGAALAQRTRIGDRLAHILRIEPSSAAPTGFESPQRAQKTPGRHGPGVRSPWLGQRDSARTAPRLRCGPLRALARCAGKGLSPFAQLRAPSGVRIPAASTKTPGQHSPGAHSLWLGQRDSNPRNGHQKPGSCRWTMPQWGGEARLSVAESPLACD